MHICSFVITLYNITKNVYLNFLVILTNFVPTHLLTRRLEYEIGIKGLIDIPQSFIPFMGLKKDYDFTNKLI
jgi:hypothetical protein